MNSRPDPSIDDLDEHLELFALGLLDDDDRDAVEHRLRQDPAARERVRELRGTLGMLALDLEPMEPPQELKGRVLDAIRATDSGGRDDVEPLAESREPVSLSSVRHERAWSSIWLPWAVAAVLAIALVASLVWDNVQQDEPDIVTYAVVSADPSISVTGELAGFQDESGALLSLAGLWRLDPDQVLQVWLINDGNAKPSVTFMPNDDGLASVVIPANIQEYQLLAITVEPAGGSAQPTTEPVIVSNLNPSSAP